MWLHINTAQNTFFVSQVHSGLVMHPSDACVIQSNLKSSIKSISIKKTYVFMKYQDILRTITHTHRGNNDRACLRCMRDTRERQLRNRAAHMFSGRTDTLCFRAVIYLPDSYFQPNRKCPLSHLLSKVSPFFFQRSLQLSPPLYLFFIFLFSHS